jgi:hypothetical protein
MNTTEEKTKNAKKWYTYCLKYDKSKSPHMKRVLYKKMEEYRKKVIGDVVLLSNEA